METWHGFIRNTTDASIVFEACMTGFLPLCLRRLDFGKRKGSGAADETRASSVFVWSETDTGIKRWHDGKAWSECSRDAGFYLYTERGKFSEVNYLSKRVVQGTNTAGKHLTLVHYYDSNSDDLKTVDQDTFINKIYYEAWKTGYIKTEGRPSKRRIRKSKAKESRVRDGDTAAVNGGLLGDMTATEERGPLSCYEGQEGKGV